MRIEDDFVNAVDQGQKIEETEREENRSLMLVSYKDQGIILSTQDGIGK